MWQGPLCYGGQRGGSGHDGGCLIFVDDHVGFGGSLAGLKFVDSLALGFVEPCAERPFPFAVEFVEPPFVVGQPSVAVEQGSFVGPFVVAVLIVVVVPSVVVGQAHVVGLQWQVDEPQQYVVAAEPPFVVVAQRSLVVEPFVVVAGLLQPCVAEQRQPFVAAEYGPSAVVGRGSSVVQVRDLVPSVHHLGHFYVWS